MDTLQNIEKYEVSKDGRQLGLVRKTGKKGFVTGFYTLAGGAHFFTDTVTWHAVPRFNEDASAALFLVARDTVSTGSKHAELYKFSNGSTEKLEGLGWKGVFSADEGLSHTVRILKECINIIYHTF